MFEIKVTVDPAFTAAVNALANSFAGKLITASNSAVAPTAPTVPVTQTAPATVPVAQTAPATVPMAAPAAAPTVPVAAPAPVAAPTAPTVPTSAPAYTQEQISRAGTTLIDMGKMNDLMALLARYGVAAITQLKPESYGAVAAELRALGAQI